MTDDQRIQEQALQLTRCLFVHLVDVIDDKEMSVEEKYNQLEWYINGFKAILF